MIIKPQTFLIVVDKTSVHRQVLHGVAICVRSFEFTTGDVAVIQRKTKNRGLIEIDRIYIRQPNCINILCNIHVKIMVSNILN